MKHLALLFILMVAIGAGFHPALAQGPGEWGDAPEGALAYPSSGVIGQFPTCYSMGSGNSYAVTSVAPGPIYFGPSSDAEIDGNAGSCPGFAPYDQDECFQDGDAGLLFPPAFTISEGEVVPCLENQGGSLGQPCSIASWGQALDIEIHCQVGQAFVSVLADWGRDGTWHPGGSCSAPDVVLLNFHVPGHYNGPLSALNPPSFKLGETGMVWFRFMITDLPIQGSYWFGEAPHGYYNYGEVEDYLLAVGNVVADEPTSWGALKSLYR